MTSVMGTYPVLCLLLVQSVIWSMCVCLPIKNAELSPWDDDDFWRRWSVPPPKRFTVKPTTKTTYSSSSDSFDTTLKIVIFVPTGIACLFILFCSSDTCKKICSGEDSESETGRVTHAPPRVYVHTTDDIRNSQQTSTLQFDYGAPGSNINVRASNSYNNVGPSNGNMNVGASNGSINVGASYNSSIVDKPPGYSDVVHSDLAEASTKFPGVHVSPTSEIPPPNYGEVNLLRF